VREMVRISDCRMSGTVSGTIVLHGPPTAASGATLSLVRDGDEVELDVEERRLDLLVSDEELERRKGKIPGYARLYCEHVMQGDSGCNFHFLRKRG
jgi:dihydroxyacid dehydratase/phosphogluconate dehydratase